MSYFNTRWILRYVISYWQILTNHHDRENWNWVRHTHKCSKYWDNMMNPLGRIYRISSAKSISKISIEVRHLSKNSQEKTAYIFLNWFDWLTEYQMNNNICISYVEEADKIWIAFELYDERDITIYARSFDLTSFERKNWFVLISKWV